jgi:protein O-mannosyl-transferase
MAPRPDTPIGGTAAWPAWLSGGLIVLAALAAYHGSFTGPLVYDDLPAIAENPTIRQLSLAALAPPSGGLTVSGRPVLNLSFALNYAVSGTSVWSYHALNLGIHILAGLALWGIARRTLRHWRKGPGGALPPEALALAIALLWTVHPLQTESVMYLAQRAESLMGLFYLLTFYCFLRAVAAAEHPGPARNLWAALAVLACLLGMGTKEVMVSAPLLVLLYDRTFVAGTFRAAWRRRRGLYLGLAATWLPLAALVAGTGGNRGGTAGFGIGVTWWGYELTQAQAIAHYLRLAVWPAPLVFDYESFGIASVGPPAPYALGVLLLGAATIWALWRFPAAGFLGAWFFAILGPTSLLPSGVQAIAEHRMYLPLAAVIAALAVGLFSLCGRLPALGLLALAALGLGFATDRRGEDYRSNLALWADTAAKRPANAFAQNNLGLALFAQGRVADAETHYARALQLDPGNAQAHYNLANILAGDGRLSRALAEYGAALQLRPNFFEAHNNLGLAYEKAGRTREAIAEFEATLRLDPTSFEARCNLADVLADNGRIAESIAQYEQALRIEPDSVPAQENLGMLLAQADRVTEAITHFEAAVRLAPGEADLHYNLGMALGHVGRNAEAGVQFEAARRLKMGNGVDPGH